MVGSPRILSKWSYVLIENVPQSIAVLRLKYLLIIIYGPKHWQMCPFDRVKRLFIYFSWMQDNH